MLPLRNRRLMIVGAAAVLVLLLLLIWLLFVPPRGVGHGVWRFYVVGMNQCFYVDENPPESGDDLLSSRVELMLQIPTVYVGRGLFMVAPVDAVLRYNAYVERVNLTIQFVAVDIDGRVVRYSFPVPPQNLLVVPAVDEVFPNGTQFNYLVALSLPETSPDTWREMVDRAIAFLDLELVWSVLLRSGYRLVWTASTRAYMYGDPANTPQQGIWETRSVIFDYTGCASTTYRVLKPGGKLYVAVEKTDEGFQLWYTTRIQTIYPEETSEHPRPLLRGSLAPQNLKKLGDIVAPLPYESSISIVRLSAVPTWLSPTFPGYGVVMLGSEGLADATGGWTRAYTTRYQPVLSAEAMRRAGVPPPETVEELLDVAMTVGADTWIDMDRGWGVENLGHYWGASEVYSDMILEGFTTYMVQLGRNRYPYSVLTQYDEEVGRRPVAPDPYDLRDATPDDWMGTQILWGGIDGRYETWFIDIGTRMHGTAEDFPSPDAWRETWFYGGAYIGIEKPPRLDRIVHLVYLQIYYDLDEGWSVEEYRAYYPDTIEPLPTEQSAIFVARDVD